MAQRQPLMGAMEAQLDSGADRKKTEETSHSGGSTPMPSIRSSFRSVRAATDLGPDRESSIRLCAPRLAIQRAALRQGPQNLQRLRMLSADRGCEITCSRGASFNGSLARRYHKRVRVPGSRRWSQLDQDSRLLCPYSYRLI